MRVVFVAAAVFLAAAQCCTFPNAERLCWGTRLTSCSLKLRLPLLYYNAPKKIYSSKKHFFMAFSFFQNLISILSLL